MSKPLEELELEIFEWANMAYGGKTAKKLEWYKSISLLPTQYLCTVNYFLPKL